MLKNRKQKVLFLMIILTLLFIWIHSLMPPETSSLESRWFTKIAAPFLELFLGKGNVSEHFVRKLAHFGEFAVLGSELFLFFKNISTRELLISWNCGLLAALIDETIQLFSGRGSAVPDVWLDFAGVVSGTVLVAVMVYLSEIKKNT